MLLQAVHSPFVAGGVATLFDLKNAVAICRLKYRESRIRRQCFPRFISRKTLKKHVALFQDYVGDYINRPEYNIIPLDIRSRTPPVRLTHPPAAVCTAYNAAMGARISIMEAWNMPIGEAYISEAMYFRSQGSQLDFLDDAEKKFQQEMKEAGLA